MRRATAIQCLLWMVGVMVGGQVMSQTKYACRLANGSFVASDRPCASTTGMTYYGPIATQAAATSYIAKISGAPDHLKYLSPRCSSMSDAIRTGSARGVSHQTTAELQRNYQRECGEDEREAHNKLSTERNETRTATTEAKQAALAGVQRSQAAQQMCDESKRILFAKKRRTDLTEGEKADLVRFEENFRTRCG